MMCLLFFCDVFSGKNVFVLFNEVKRELENERR